MVNIELLLYLALVLVPSILSGVSGAKYKKLRNAFKLISKAYVDYEGSTKKLVDLGVTIAETLEDRKVTKTEAREIVNGMREYIDELREEGIVE